MKTSLRLRNFLLAAASSLMAVSSASAQLYWDTDGTTAGFGTAPGTWGTDAFWNSAAAGDGTGSFTAATTTTSALNFGTATLGLGAGTINVGTVDSGNMTFGAASGAITLIGGTITFGGTSSITVNNASNTINSTLAGLSTSLTKLGTGTLTLGASNGYAGSTLISRGTLRSTATTGTPFGTGSVTFGLARGGTNNGAEGSILALAPSLVSSGTDISLSGGNASNAALFTFNPSSILSLDKGGNNSLTYTFNRTNAAAGLVRGTNGTLILSVGAMANLGNTVANGGERFIINNGTSTPVTLTHGIVIGMVAQDRGNSNAGDFVTYDTADGFKKATYGLSNTFSGSASTSIVEITSATSTTATTAAYAIKVSGATVDNTGNTTTLGSGLILNNATFSGGTLTGTERTIYVTGNSAISSSITGTGGLNIIGPGTLDFSDNSVGNTFSNILRVNNSTVIVSADNQLGASGRAAELYGGTIQTSGTVSIGARPLLLSASQDQSGGILKVTSGTTTWNSSSTTNNIRGTGSLIKTGAGTLTLTGVSYNTHSGGTFVNEGTLLVNSTANDTGRTATGAAGSSLFVASGATLGGTGIVGSSVIATGSIAPGTTGIGTLNVGATTWKGAATAGSATDWKFNLGASDTEDFLNITGNFTKDNSAGSNFRFDFLNSAVAGTFNLITWSGSNVGFSAGDFTAFNLGTGYTGSFSINGSTLQLTTTFIPEPSSALLSGLLIGAGLLRRRRSA